MNHQWLLVRNVGYPSLAILGELYQESICLSKRFRGGLSTQWSPIWCWQEELTFCVCQEENELTREPQSNLYCQPSQLETVFRALPAPSWHGVTFCFDLAFKKTLQGSNQASISWCLISITGRPGVLRFMGSQRVGHDWATELTEFL